MAGRAVGFIDWLGLFGKFTAHVAFWCDILHAVAARAENRDEQDAKRLRANYRTRGNRLPQLVNRFIARFGTKRTYFFEPQLDWLAAERIASAWLSLMSPRARNSFTACAVAATYWP